MIDMMDALETINSRACLMNAAWHEAAIGGGAVLLLIGSRNHRHQPTDEDVGRAARLYRQFYGNAAHGIIGDHMLAAS